MPGVNEAIAEQLRRLGGVKIVSSGLIPEGVVYRIGAEVVIGPLTFWSWTHDMKTPMLSRNCRGMHELERDRRKHR